MFKKFGTNAKKYCDYLMTVNFTDLFINDLILICILVLSSFVFMPVGLLKTLIRDFILLFMDVNGTILSVYDWIFTLISTVLTIVAFIYMFNKRFEDLETFKKQLKEKPQKDIKDTSDNEEELILPKTKDEK